MRTLFIIFFYLISSNVFAWSEGKFLCYDASRLYTVTALKVGGVKLPYVIRQDLSRDGTISNIAVEGIAAIHHHGGKESLMFYQDDGLRFEGNQPAAQCKRVYN